MSALRGASRRSDCLRLALLVLTLSISALALGPTPAKAGLTWTGQVVDSGGSVGRHSSLAIAPNGTMFVLYVDDTRGILKFATSEGTGWALSIVDGPSLFDGDTNVRIDRNGNLRITYYDSLSGNVRYGTRAGVGGAWNLTDVDRGLNEGYNQLAIDALGAAHVAYAWDNGTLRYAVFNGSNWTRQSLDRQVIIARYVSLALDGNGDPHLAYYGNGHLRYTSRKGATWTTEEIDSREGVGLFSRVAIDGADHAHIAYYDSIARSLRYATRVGNGWAFTVVDGSGDAGWDLSLALALDGSPRITYYARVPADLRYAELRLGAWAIQTVDDAGVVGWESSLALAADELPSVSYFDWTHTSLKYASGASVLGVRTVGPGQLTETTAQLEGEITSLGPFASANASFEWRPVGESSWRATEALAGQLPGPYSLTIGGLVPGAVYEFRGVVRAGGSTANGEIVSLGTRAPPMVDWPLVLLVVASVVVATVGVAAALFAWRRFPPPKPRDDTPRNGQA